jgi:hypothetical protein
MNGPLRTTSVLLLVLTGCLVAEIGPTVESFPPASRGAGVWTSLQLGSGAVHGELLEARDTALLLLRGGEIVLVPFAAIRRGEFRHLDVRIGRGRPPSAAIHDRIRLVSRFPYGLSDEGWERLLSVSGQAAPRVVR